MNGGLILGKRFFKAHGHGNDYLVFQEGRDWWVSPRTIQAVCNRQRGPGGDGIVALLAPGGGKDGEVETPPDPGSTFRLRMFNPDGSEFERSGNGLRVLGAYLQRRGWVVLQQPFPVEVGGGRVEMEILGPENEGVLPVAVEMGQVAFGMHAVGGREGAIGTDSTIPGPRGEPLFVQPVSVGNPHCVVFQEDLTEERLSSLGPFLTRHPAFPRGINVQLVEVVDEGRVKILIWERGVGRTASSGTSACAVAAACVQRGYLEPGRIGVLMEGGTFTVTVSPDATVRLEGPVQSVCEGDLTEGMLASLS